MPIKVQGGKEYFTVAERLVKKNELFENHTIQTSMVHIDSACVVMKAQILHEDRVVSSAHGMGYFGRDGFTDKLIEKTETVAVGRALAFLHPDLMGSEVASADEVSDARLLEQEKRLNKWYTEHTQAVERQRESLEAIRGFLAEDNLAAALEAWREIGEEDMKKLWRAPSKGGWFTTRERSQLDQAATEDSIARKAGG